MRITARLITAWWGILGLIGWGYLVAAFHLPGSTRQYSKYCRWHSSSSFSLNILSKLDLLNSLDQAKADLRGNYRRQCASYSTGRSALQALILKKYSAIDFRMAIVTIVTIGVLSLIAGFVLRNWFIISKIQATPSWGLICNGISMMLFALLYWIIDIKKQMKWTLIFKPAGENSLTTYLAPDIIYYLIWSTGIPILIL
ncbi:MAG: hypothetical protein MZV63_51135 [Marinilabiliales bacterium]|nr:hypothetical protein [Marinilabiliales bacterium]